MRRGQTWTCPRLGAADVKITPLTKVTLPYTLTCKVSHIETKRFISRARSSTRGTWTCPRLSTSAELYPDTRNHHHPATATADHEWRHE